MLTGKGAPGAPNTLMIGGFDGVAFGGTCVGFLDLLGPFLGPLRGFRFNFWVLL